MTKILGLGASEPNTTANGEPPVDLSQKTAQPDKAMLDFNFSNLETSDLGHTETGAQSARAGFGNLNIDQPDDIH
jgi:hypothetical protein